MGVYTVNAAINGVATALTTVDTATMAAAKVHSALERYARVWVTDEMGEDIDVAQLRQLVEREQSAGNA